MDSRLPLPRALAAALLTLLTLATWLAPREARAFCGFYVSGAEGKLFADATQVVMMREGTRTVLSMQNDYKGPPEGFAMVVPVPVVLQRESVKTLPRDIFDRVDKLSAPRLVEYWEQDPCAKPDDFGGLGLSGIGEGGGGRGEGIGLGSIGRVKIEARFEVGEYEIVILSAQDSSGLDAWLRQNGYKIPANAEPALRPYVAAGSKFFVAKVNVAKVKFEGGRATLSPLRFHYDSEKFELPVRLGMLNSSGTQDLIVQILAPERYVVANYPNVTIPTNLDVADAARGSFGAFYAALLDRTLEKNRGAVVSEYAWPSSNCDPCPGTVGGLSQSDVATLGADVLPSTKLGPAGSGAEVRMGALQVTGALPPEVVQRIVRQNFGRFRLCYENGLRTNPKLAGRVSVKFGIDASGAVTTATDGGSDLPDAQVTKCVVAAFPKLSFPNPTDGKPVQVVFPVNFAPGSPVISLSRTNFVLTRLHARYGKDALGNDLVFKTAPAVVGGREIRGRTGALETGATPAPTNSFQARYVIRHSWPGAIACTAPKRGVWGGPWAGTHGGLSTPMAAQKLAYAPRGNLTLAAFVPQGVPELAIAPGSAPPAVAASADPADSGSAAPASSEATSAADASSLGTGDSGHPDASLAGAPPPAPASRCGCRVIARSNEVAPSLAALAIAAALVLRRRRR